MALTLKTPGVYVEEVSTLPASVAAVATAIPAFIGYTERGTLNTPTRIVSMLEFEAAFGGPAHEVFSVSVTGYPTSAPVVTFANPSKFNMHYQLQMYFGNGGGPCYIVSIGDYATVNPFSSSTPFTTGITNAEKADEITLLVVPEAINLTSQADRKAVNDALLANCAKLGDRFAIMDVLTTTNINTDSTQFRGNEVGINNLKYGAAYYPSMNTVIPRFYLDKEVTITGSAVYTPTPNNVLSSVLSGVAAWATLTVGTPVNGDFFVLASVQFTGRTGALLSNTDFKLAGGASGIATNIANVINNHPTIGALVYAKVASNVVTIVAKTGGVAGNFTLTGDSDYGPSSVTAGVDNTQNTALYGDIKLLLNAYKLSLYPAATMAGIYASVDNTRGVWKAPANVSVSLVADPGIQITNESQENLNVDVTGKSINAIRTFLGRGVIVWGARTLDGNSNEWRYVNVRRLFIMAEESCKKASEFVVFEPNDKNTWSRVKGMIGNFLTSLWRDGALAGDKPDQAFFVKVGLNETMTAQDILEGRLIVEIGMAAVRPAEFIVLRFSHKLQEA